VPRAVFGRGKVADFESVSTVIPENPDEYLRALYGDYMTPPPPEKRVTRHATSEVDLSQAVRTWAGSK
jgi:lipopolysaccharide cholinephosphotransferase